MAVKIGTDPNVPVGRTTEVTAISITTFLEKANNLSDVQDAATARTNLGVTNQTHFTYIGFADSIDGNDFSATYDDSKLFWAVKISATALTPVVGDFAGLWIPFEKQRDDNLPTYMNEKSIDYNVGHWNSLSMANPSALPVAWHYHGTYNRCYFVILDALVDSEGNARTGGTHKSYIGYYDISDGVFSALVEIAQDFPAATDYHDVPSMIVSDSGHILVSKEKLVSAGGSHNSELEIYRSDSVEDISSFTKVAEFERQTDPNSDFDYAYPHFVKTITDGELLVICRARKLGGDLSYLVGFMSTNNGSTWTGIDGDAYQATEIANFFNGIGSASINWYFYHMEAKGKREHGIHLFGNLNEGGTATSNDGQPTASKYKYIVHIHSYDGITWRNMHNYINGSGGFTKNIVTGSEITPAELLANCVVSDVATDVHESMSIYDVSLDVDGNPYVIALNYFSYAASLTPNYLYKSNKVEGVYVFRYTGGSWTQTDITSILVNSNNTYSDADEVSAFHFRPLIMAYRDGIIDVMLRVMIEDDHFYEPAHTPITSLANVIDGQIYRIIATAADNFFEGCAVGDYYDHNGGLTPTVDGSNSLVPVREVIRVVRSKDHGATWFQVKPDSEDKFHKYSQKNPASGVNFNIHDSGYQIVIHGSGIRVSEGMAMDHSAYTFFIDKIQL